MRTRAAILFFVLFVAARSGTAIDIETPKNQPIEITSTGETRYENGVAIARDNVAIHCGDADIYADSARYDSQRHEVSAEGHVRIYREDKLYLAEHGTYNLDTKEIHADTLQTSSEPYFVIAEKIKGTVRLDYRVRRGAAIGFESEMNYGKDDSSYLRLKTYFIDDQNPELNQTSVPRGAIGSARYRVTVEDRTNFTSDIYGIVDITKLSDAYVMEDFYQSEFRINPVPDNVVAVTKVDPIYTLTAIARFQANGFFQQTERLPEVVLDVARTPIFRGPLFYQGEAGMVVVHRNFENGSVFEDYESWRINTFHQLLYPNTYFGWLSIVPRAGFRATYYNETRDLGKTLFVPSTNPLIPDFLVPDNTPLQLDGDKTRTVFNAGVEASFKISRAWEEAQNSALGLDGLRHVIQPFTNFSWVSDPSVNPAAILQFDRVEPTTKLHPIDFPEFTTIYSIDRWTIWRLA